MFEERRSAAGHVRNVPRQSVTLEFKRAHVYDAVVDAWIAVEVLDDVNQKRAVVTGVVAGRAGREPIVATGLVYKQRIAVHIADAGVAALNIAVFYLAASADQNYRQLIQYLRSNPD